MILLEYQSQLNLSQTGITRKPIDFRLFNQPQIRRLGSQNSAGRCSRQARFTLLWQEFWKIVHKCPRGGRSRLVIVVLDETALPHVIIHYSSPSRFPEIYFLGIQGLFTPIFFSLVATLAIIEKIEKIHQLRDVCGNNHVQDIGKNFSSIRFYSILRIVVKRFNIYFNIYYRAFNNILI